MANNVKIKLNYNAIDRFEKLDAGDFFTVTGDEDDVYVKMRGYFSVPDEPGDMVNALNVSTGQATYFYDGDITRKLKGELRFEYE